MTSCEESTQLIATAETRSYPTSLPTRHSKGKSVQRLRVALLFPGALLVLEGLLLLPAATAATDIHKGRGVPDSE